MKKKAAVLVVLTVSLFAFQAWGEESKLTGLKYDLTKMTCKELMSGNDMDRAIGLGVFHGFLMGRKNNTVADVPAMAVVSDEVTDFCLSNPNSTVMDAFTRTVK